VKTRSVVAVAYCRVSRTEQNCRTTIVKFPQLEWCSNFIISKTEDFKWYFKHVAKCTLSVYYCGAFTVSLPLIFSSWIPFYSLKLVNAPARESFRGVRLKTVSTRSRDATHVLVSLTYTQVHGFAFMKLTTWEYREITPDLSLNDFSLWCLLYKI
jgi:hypothetical protein